MFVSGLSMLYLCLLTLLHTGLPNFLRCPWCCARSLHLWLYNERRRSAFRFKRQGNGMSLMMNQMTSSFALDQVFSAVSLLYRLSYTSRSLYNTLPWIVIVIVILIK
jgi:hypothetical protein